LGVDRKESVELIFCDARNWQVANPDSGFRYDDVDVPDVPVRCRADLRTAER
jgi:hypothetical protein